MDWWQTLLSTTAGAIIGGVVVVAGEMLRQRSQEKIQQQKFKEERRAAQRDDERRWMLELQEAGSQLVIQTQAILPQRDAGDQTGPDRVAPQDELRRLERLRKDLIRVRLLAVRTNDAEVRDLGLSLSTLALSVRDTDPSDSAEERMSELANAYDKLNLMIGEQLFRL
jgi:hypothetical protein